jgi:hypothetical protein
MSAGQRKKNKSPTPAGIKKQLNNENQPQQKQSFFAGGIAQGGQQSRRVYACLEMYSRRNEVSHR